MRISSFVKMSTATVHKVKIGAAISKAGLDTDKKGE